MIYQCFLTPTQNKWYFERNNRIRFVCLKNVVRIRYGRYFLGRFRWSESILEHPGDRLYQEIPSAIRFHILELSGRNRVRRYVKLREDVDGQRVLTGTHSLYRKKLIQRTSLFGELSVY